MRTASHRSGVRSYAAQRPRLTVVAAAKGFGTARKVPPKFPKEAPSLPEPCPCQSGKAYKNCCDPIHKGQNQADTAELTLKARFSAFVKGQPEYIISTTHPDYHIFHYQVPTPGGAEEKLRNDVAAACNKFAYMGLKVVGTEPGVNDNECYLSYEYLHRPRSAPGAPLTEEELKNTTAWSRTAERGRYLRVSSGVWQFVDYQTATFDANMLAGVAQPE